MLFTDVERKNEEFSYHLITDARMPRATKHPPPTPIKEGSSLKASLGHLSFSLLQGSIAMNLPAHPISDHLTSVFPAETSATERIGEFSALAV